jgi:hypothetical protein
VGLEEVEGEEGVEVVEVAVEEVVPEQEEPGDEEGRAAGRGIVLTKNGLLRCCVRKLGP